MPAARHEPDGDFTVEAPAGEGSEPLEVPAPTLLCGDDEVELDLDVSNFPSELDPGSDDRGTWGWTPTGECERGSFEVGDVTFEFDEVPLR